tara:strand:+ start:179 stop:994 length:816 start_codon:yes stop_codon:yes gene_type:complete
MNREAPGFAPENFKVEDQAENPEIEAGNIQEEIDQEKTKAKGLRKNIRQLVKTLGIPAAVLLSNLGPAFAEETSSPEEDNKPKVEQYNSQEQEGNQEKLDINKLRDNLERLLVRVEESSFQNIDRQINRNADLAKSLYKETKEDSSFEELSESYYKFIRKLDLNCDKDITPEIAGYMLKNGIGLEPRYGTTEIGGQKLENKFNLSDINYDEIGQQGFGFSGSDAVEFKIVEDTLYVQEEYNGEFFYYKFSNPEKPGLEFEQATEEDFKKGE